jgi:hypothetical protein
LQKGRYSKEELLAEIKSALVEFGTHPPFAASEPDGKSPE